MHIAKRLALAGLIACATLVPASGAGAAGAGAVSFTQTFKNVTEVSIDVNPCTGAPGMLTITYNGVFHVTELTSGIGAGTFWATGTQTGTFTFAPFDASQPSFTGRCSAPAAGPATSPPKPPRITEMKLRFIPLHMM